MSSIGVIYSNISLVHWTNAMVDKYRRITSPNPQEGCIRFCSSCWHILYFIKSSLISSHSVQSGISTDWEQANGLTFMLVCWMKSILALVLVHAVKCSSDDVQTMYRIGCPNLIYVESGHNPITFALSLAYFLKDDRSKFIA